MGILDVSRRIMTTDVRSNDDLPPSKMKVNYGEMRKEKIV